MARIVVIGTGMAGFGASSALNAEGIRPAVYDKNSYYGGHTASFKDDQGFVFDLGPHISFTKDSRMQDLFAGTQPYLELKTRLLRNVNTTLHEIFMSFLFRKLILGQTRV